MDFPFYFPIAILLLDDDQDILDNIAQTFSYMFPGREIYKMTSSFGAIDFCQSNALKFSALPINFEFNSIEGRGEARFETGLLNLASLQKHSQEVGMIVLDYAMPEMSGVEFARRISQHSIPKILLTGQATTDEALLAFNCGLIDKYIGKDQNDVLSSLKEYILELESKYFSEINKQFRCLIGESTLAFLSIPEVCKALRRVCASIEAKIVGPSFSPPGLFVLTETDEQYLLVVIDDDIMEAQIEIALIEDISPQLIERMHARTHIYVTDIPQITGHVGAGFFPITPLSTGTYFSKIKM